MSRTHHDFPPSSILYADLREKWKHEDDLINQRVTWLLNSQGFLLSAFGVLAKFRLDLEVSTADMLLILGNHLWVLYGLGEILITFCAVVVTFYMRGSVVAATKAMKEIFEQLKDHKENDRIWHGIRVDVLTGAFEEGAAPSRVMATLFLSVWSLCLTYEAHRNVSILFQWASLGFPRL